MEWLHPFIALALCCSVVTTLLPEGSLKRTAALVIGLMLTLCWAECLAGLFRWPEPDTTSAAILTPTAYRWEDALAQFASPGGD